MDILLPNGQVLAVVGYVQDPIQGLIPSLGTDQSVQVDFVGGSNPIYIAFAAPGSLTNQPVWQIRKCAFDGAGNLQSMLLANGSSLYNQVYDNRASLSYS